MDKHEFLNGVIGVDGRTISRTPNLRNLLEEFKELKNFATGEGIIEASVDSWMVKRRKAKKRVCLKKELPGSVLSLNLNLLLH